MEPPSVHFVSVFIPMIFDDINQLLCHFKSTLHFIWSDNFILQMLYPQCDCRHQLERVVVVVVEVTVVAVVVDVVVVVVVVVVVDVEVVLPT